MTYVVNNAADAAAVTYPNLSWPQRGDFAAISVATDGYGVVSGAAVTYGGLGRAVAVASGVVRIDGTDYTMAGTSVTPAAGDGSNPRWDLIVAGVSTGVAAAAVVAGTAAATPEFPTVSATQVLLAAVWVPTSAANLTATNIQDKRINVPAYEWVLAPAPTGGDDKSMLAAYMTAWAGEQIQLREGTYSIDGARPTVPANTVLRGWGTRDTIIQKRAGATQPDSIVLQLSSGIRLENLVIDGNKANVTVSPAPGDVDQDPTIYTGNGTTFWKIVDCQIKDSEYGGLGGKSTDYLIDDCDFTGVTRMAISMAGGSHRGTIRDTRIIDPGIKGITYADESGTLTNEDVQVLNCTIDMSGTDMSTDKGGYLAIELQGCPYGLVDGCTIEFNTAIPAQPPFGISLAAASNYSRATNNVVRGAAVMALEGANSRGLHFIGNTVTGHASSGLDISSNEAGRPCVDYTIIGNEFANGLNFTNTNSSRGIKIACTSGNYISGMNITGNTFVDAGYQAIFLDGGSTGQLKDSTVVGNTIVLRDASISDHIYAIYLQDCAGILVSSNTIGPGAGGTCTHGLMMRFQTSLSVVERMVIANNRMNGAAASGGNLCYSPYLFDGNIDYSLIQGNNTENYQRAAWQVNQTTAAKPNAYIHNYHAGTVAYDGIKADDYVILFQDTVVAAGKTLRQVDDFVGGGTTTGAIGNLGWNMGGAGTTTVAIQAASAGRPGILRLSTGATSGNVGVLSLGGATTTTGIVAAADNWDFTVSLAPVATTNTSVRVGVGNGLTTAPPTDGVWIDKENATTNWVGDTKTGGSTSSTAAFTATASAGTFVKLRIRRVNSTTVGFTVNDETEKTLTTNIPTSTMIPFIMVVAGNAGAKSADIDYADFRVATLSR